MGDLDLRRTGMSDFRHRDIQRAISAAVDRQNELEAQGRHDEVRLVQHDIEELETELCYLEDEYQMTLDFDDET